MKNILVPVDFTEISMKGLEVAVKIAQRTRATIILFNAIEPVGSSGFSTMGGGSESVSVADRYIVELYRIHQEKLMKFVNKFSSIQVPMKVSIVIDSYRKGIRKFIKNHKIDLVVMGTSGENDYTEIFDGNHTEQVIRGTDCPVIAVRDCKTNYEPKNILLVNNGEDVAGGMRLSYFGKLASVLQANVHVMSSTSRDLIENKIKNSGIKNFSFEKLSDVKNIASVIDYAHQHSIDMIAMIAKGKASWLRVFSQTPCEHLIRQSDIPVLALEVK